MTSPTQRYSAEQIKRYEDIAKRMVEDRKRDGAIGWGAEAWKVWQALAEILEQAAEDAARLEQMHEYLKAELASYAGDYPSPDREVTQDHLDHFESLLSPRPSPREER